VNASDQIETEIRVKLLPRSSRNQILGREHDILKVKVTAPPVDGQANKTLIEFLAKRLGVSKGSVQIVSGKAGRLKGVRIHGLSFEDVMERLE
jgi:uncharacterized protein (TIGR00251 family)